MDNFDFVLDVGGRFFRGRRCVDIAMAIEADEFSDLDGGFHSDADTSGPDSTAGLDRSGLVCRAAKLPVATGREPDDRGAEQ